MFAWVDSFGQREERERNRRVARALEPAGPVDREVCEGHAGMSMYVYVLHIYI